MKSTGVSYGNSTRIGVRRNIENMYIPDCGAVNRQPFPGTFSGGVWI